VTKSSVEGLPKTENYFIAVDATPFLNYLGNTFNGKTNNALNLNSTTIYGKYFLSNENAVRVILSVNSSNNTNRYYVQDDAALASDPLSTDQVTDIHKDKNRSFYLAGGYEFRENYKKFVGFYGGQLGYAYSRNTDEYIYGNPMSALNQAPTTAWGSPATRTLFDDSGKSHTVSLGLLAGVEYYFMRHACIGGEIGLNVAYTWESQGDTKYEEWDGSQAYEYDRPNSPGDTYLSIRSALPFTYGGLYLGFFF
jgi:hypothetical protein